MTKERLIEIRAYMELLNDIKKKYQMPESETMLICLELLDALEKIVL